MGAAVVGRDRDQAGTGSSVSRASVASTSRSSGLAECVKADHAGAVDEDQARATAQPVARHRDRRAAGLTGPVDTDGERDPVFVRERFQCHRRRRLVVLEHRVQAEHGDFASEVRGRSAGPEVVRAWRTDLHTRSTGRCCRLLLGHRAGPSGGRDYGG